MAPGFMSVALPSLRLSSAALVSAYAILGLTGFGMFGALVHAGWFWLLLTRAGRGLLLVLSAILGGMWFMTCATPSGGVGTCAAGAALALIVACAWMAAGGVNRLEGSWHGWASESRTRAALDRLARKASGRVLVRHSVLLRVGNHFTEIDHVLLCPGGVVVIETKGHSGFVERDPDTGAWLRSRASGLTEEIDDPMVQNEGHSRAIRALFPDLPVAPLVVMTDAVLGESVPEGVVTLQALVRSLGPWLEKMGGNLDAKDLVRRLDRANQSCTANRRLHLKSVQAFRGQSGSPIWQRRLAALATVLYFGTPCGVLLGAMAGGYPAWVYW